MSKKVASILGAKLAPSNQKFCVHPWWCCGFLTSDM